MNADYRRSEHNENAPQFGPRALRHDGELPTEKPSRMPSANVVIFVLNCFLLVVMMAIWRSFTQRRTPDRTRMALGSASRIAMAIGVYQVNYNQLPAETQYRAARNPDGKYENSEIMDQLDCGEHKFLRLSAEEKNQAGSFIDPWGQPYRIMFGKDGTFQVYSCGPNQRWDGGKKDDISSP